MTIEEVLIVLLAVASALFLFVGLAQALEGRPRRVPLRRAHALSPHHRPAVPVAAPAEVSRARGGRIFADAAPDTALRTAAAVELEPVTTPLAPTVSEVAAPPAAMDEAPGRMEPEQISLLDMPVEAPPHLAVPEPLVEAPPRLAAAEPVVEALEAATPGPMEAEIMAVEERAAEPEPLRVAEPPGDPERLAEAESPHDPEPMAAAPTAASVGTPLATDLVVEAVRLFKGGQYDALLATLEPALKVRGRARNRAPVSYERALLSAMAGLAHRARGEEAAMRAAFDQGVRALPKTDVNGSEHRVMPLAEAVGSRLLSDGEAAGDGSPATLATLRLAVGLLRGVAIAQGSQAPADLATAPALPALDLLPADSGGDDLPPWGKALRAHLAVERARDAVATAAERRLGGFLGKRDHSGGHRWLREVMDWDELGERRAPLEDAYWQSVGTEMTRLTGSALESGDDLTGATAALASAEALIASLPPESAESPRFDELRRRLWWGHIKLGLQRLDGGDPTGALEPLYRALRLAAGDGDREAETRHALAQALDAQASGASARIEGLLEAGDRVGAETAGQELCRAIDRGLAEGVSQEELVDALAKRQDVMARIAQAV